MAVSEPAQFGINTKYNTDGGRHTVFAYATRRWELMDDREQVSERISALLDELMDLVKPVRCDDPECTAIHDDMPEGPWMLSGWVLAVDVTAEGAEDVETWTTSWRSKGLPRTQALGLGATIVRSNGG